MRGIRSLALIVALLGAMLPLSQVAAQSGSRCFPETGYCISGRLRQFWEQNGALPVFGYPLGPVQEVLQSDLSFVYPGPTILLVQVFERVRLELHPENAPPYDVLLGALGAELVIAPPRGPRTAGPAGGAGRPRLHRRRCTRLPEPWREEIRNPARPRRRRRP